MRLRATERGKHVSREEMLQSKPIRNQLIEWEKDDNGEVVIILTRGENWRIKLLSKFFYIPERRRISLDEIGSQVWEMCDGKHTLRAMIKHLRNQYKLNPKEAEISLTSYLKKLGQKRLIGLAVPKRQRK